MAKRRDVDFVVEGTAPFPFDMLRYDGCFPSREADAREMGHRTGDGPCLRVHLRKAAVEGRWAPTAERWRSFGWKVVGVAARDLPLYCSEKDPCEVCAKDPVRRAERAQRRADDHAV